MTKLTSYWTKETRTTSLKLDSLLETLTKCFECLVLNLKDAFDCLFGLFLVQRKDDDKVRTKS
jgi:hypothetical protein